MIQPNEVLIDVQDMHKVFVTEEVETHALSGVHLQIKSLDTVDPSLVAGGIKVALLTTAAGLIIAIPVNIAYNFFVSRVDQLIMDMEHGAQKILNLAWDLEKRGQLQVVKVEK